MRIDPGERLLVPGRTAAGAAPRGWPSALSLAAHGVAIAVAIWLAAALRPLPQIAANAGVSVVFRPALQPLAPPGTPAPPQPLPMPAAPSVAPPAPALPAPAAVAPAVPSPPEPLAAPAAPPAVPAPPELPATAAAPPAMPTRPEPLAAPAVPSIPAPPALPEPQRQVPLPARHAAAAHGGRPRRRAAAAPTAIPSAPAAPAAAASSGAPSAPAAAAMMPPRPVSGAAGNAPPAYPESARRRGEQGRVVLRVLVSAAGRAVSVAVVRSSGYRVLDTAAADAVQQWRFVPASRGGISVTGTAEVPVNFELEN